VTELLMRRTFKILLGIVGLATLMLVAARAYLRAGYVQSKIVDFHPTNFEAKADTPFFYSIGDELKHSDELEPQAMTLLKGQIENFLVSPDGSMIAVVANGRLSIVTAENPAVREVAPVESIYREPKPMGQGFYRDDDFQWSRDSKTLYLIRDEYYDSKGSQLYSSKGELWKYDIHTGSMQLVLKSFPAFNYFFGLNEGLYFSVPTKDGDLQLKYFEGHGVKDVDKPNAWSIAPDHLSAKFAETPFFSFSLIDYQEKVLPAKGVELAIEGQFEKLDIGNKPFLTLKEGRGIKGGYFCSETIRSVFLPGDRYFLFNLPYCENFNGQLLIDTRTGQYRTLPQGTRVYLTDNTLTNSHYRITGSGMLAQ
jgi:hypothetical protein